MITGYFEMLSIKLRLHVIIKISDYRLLYDY